MKTTYLRTAVLIVIAVQFLGSCTKDFLEVAPRGTQIESNYYKNPEEAFNGLIATYDPVGWEGFNGNANFIALNIASDDHLSGGSSSTDGYSYQVWHTYTLTATDGPQISFWSRNFAGISRANTLISKLESKIPGLSEALTKRYLAEAKFLRAYFYFDLVRLFGRVPLFTEPLSTEKIYEVEQVSPSETYAQIEKDLKEAIDEPNLPNTVQATTEGGRVTKGAAKALLGKVYLYEKKWADAAKEFGEVNGTPGGTSTYGYKLLAKFSDIFVPTNKFNSESVFEVVHTNLAASGNAPLQLTEGFMASTMVGPRGYSGPFYYSAWGFSPVSDDLFNAIHYDPRYKATVADLDSLVKIKAAKYTPSYLNTGHFVQKFAPLTAYRSTTGGNILRNYPQDYIEIRLADTYLMEAEALVQAGGNASRAAALLNAVRNRVGLVPVAATLDNIYKERRLELATEGHRWYDLVRTGRAATLLKPKGFVAGKHEFLPIPFQELTNTKMVQNLGYN
ncbi:MAG: RagB/SusD family nutrient uptake outer membrane protein [Daejeonella sp.]